MRPQDKYWNALVEYLTKKGLENEIFFGPGALFPEFPKIYPYQILKNIRLSDYEIEYAVFHKDPSEPYTNEFLHMLRNDYKAVWGNKSFVIFKKHPGKWEKIKAKKYLFHTQIRWKKYEKPAASAKTGILITTRNTPHFLRRMLEQLQNRPEEILVVNEGSGDHFRAEYEAVQRDFPGITFIDLPANRGRIFSLNTGFSWFLADPGVEWIHYFQDNLILHPGFFDTVQKVAHKEKYPVVTGIYHEAHKICKRGTINGIPVYMLRSAPGEHLFVHRLYLQENLPVPVLTGKPGQENQSGEHETQDAAWWMLSYAPLTVVKRDKYIVCVPGICHTEKSAT